MNRITALVAATFLALMPLTASAGSGPVASTTEVAPVFESGSPSGIVLLEAGGYLYGYNMLGTTITGEGALPPLPAGYTLAANDTLGWPDLDGNGISDIVIQASGGYLYAYLMQDAGAFVSILSEGAIPAIPPTYTLLGWPDLDGDGDSDMVIQEPGGYTFAYLMDGVSTPEGMGAIPGLPTGTYSTIGFPDLDGVNGADVVIQEAGGYTVGYLIDGVDPPSASGQIPGPPGGTYSTIGFPNLDGLAGDDIVIQEAGGYTYAYLMNGLTSSSDGQVPGLGGYTTIGFPDMDDANGADIVIQASTGYTVAYIMNGLTESANGVVAAAPTGYTTIGFPNLDDTNGADIVIQEAGGYTFAYFYDATGLTESGSGAIPGPPSMGSYVTVPWETNGPVLP